MTIDERRQIGFLFDELNHATRPAPAPSPIPAILFGCLCICVTLVFYPELRFAASCLEIWLHAHFAL
jgi:hypothetical protein